ncbi:MAG: RNA polymerase sporulation sigma factor SigK [Oscillospiraceae bacterium]|jgi:RNA polymerase sporulation-specific sigma factor|nr:RNA polymerase sporulation sigma factor SigK [Oscillospiraceae bacterium]
MFGVVVTLLLQGYVLCLRLTGRGGSFPRPLTKKEESEALEAMAAGDAAAREKLIMHNLRLVPHVIKKYYVGAADQDDLISIGTIGLVKAIDSFSPGKKAKLPTYACICIQNEIFMHFRNLRKRAGELSLSDPLEAESDGSPLSVMDVLQADDDVQDRLEHEEECRRVRQLVETALDDRQREIIRLRYGLGGSRPLTQREVAERFGISRSYVSRIEKKALETLAGEMPAP